jgi:hypothetical protein
MRPMTKQPGFGKMLAGYFASYGTARGLHEPELRCISPCRMALSSTGNPILQRNFNPWST